MESNKKKHENMFFLFCLCIFVFVFINLTILFNKALAASFEFTNSGASLSNSGCVVSVNIEIDLGSNVSNAADIEISYSTSDITIIDSDPNQNGVQIKTGNAYESYFYNQVFQNTGKIKVAGMSLSTPLTGRKLFGTIEFIPKPNVTSTNFVISFNGVGNTLDSNIADKNTNQDLLTNVINGFYTFSNNNGSCSVSTNNQVTSDNINPKIIIIQPSTNNINVNSSIIFKVEDFESGIDINTLEIYLNNTLFDVNSQYSQINQTVNGYIIVFSPDFLQNNQNYLFKVKIKDMFGNSSEFENNFLASEAIYTQVSSPLTYSNTIFGIPNNSPFYFMKDFILFSKDSDFSSFSLLSLFAGILPLIAFSNLPISILNLLFILLGKKNKNIWGLVLDFSTKQPIPFVTVKVYASQTTLFITQTVTDLEGRYGFILNDGRYRVEFNKDGYNKNVVEIYVKNGIHNIPQEIFLTKVELTSLSKQSSSYIGYIFRSNIRNIIEKISNLVLLMGLILAFLALIINSNLMNILLLLLYFLLFFLKTKEYKFSGIKAGSVVDASTNFRIPLATVKVYDLNKNLVDIKKTNVSGYFDFYINPGVYLIEVIAFGYSFPSLLQKQSNNIVDGKYLKTYLRKGGNYLQIYLDPINQNLRNQAVTERNNNSSFGVVNGNLPNPFV